MRPMDEKDFTIFKNIAQTSQDKLLKSLTKILRAKYGETKVWSNLDYILCEGNIPIMLVAHLDTVFKTLPREIYYDYKKQVMWSPQGLGADDRAGVFSILKIVRKGFRPHICFTTDEEIGSRGASVLIKDMKKSPFDIKYIIELDRQGANDCVFYSCDNKEFEKFVEDFGFVTDWGTFSDISDICPAWKIAGVNLSVGYFTEHSIAETLHTNFMYSTIEKVCNMLKAHESAPYFEYKEDLSFARFGKYWKVANYPMDEWETCESKIICNHCLRAVPFDEAVKVRDKDILGVSRYYCLDCLTASDNIEYCLLCGEPFEKRFDKDKICVNCRSNFPEVSVISSGSSKD